MAACGGKAKRQFRPVAVGTARGGFLLPCVVRCVWPHACPVSCRQGWPCRQPCTRRCRCCQRRQLSKQILSVFFGPRGGPCNTDFAVRNRQSIKQQQALEALLRRQRLLRVVA